MKVDSLLSDISNAFRSIIKEEVQDGVKKALLEHHKEETKNSILTRKDVAKMHGISLVTLNKWVKSGKIKAHRRGSRLYFKKSEIMDMKEVA